MSRRWLQALLLAGCAALAGCAGASARDVSSDTAPAISEARDASAGDEGEALVAKAGEVDDSCKVDADCAVKNVGNCCGYFPACVNAASPTFPEQVKADCAREGRMAICGFREVRGCQCVEGRCEDIHGSASEVQ